jgi:hypothetical protein
MAMATAKSAARGERRHAAILRQRGAPEAFNEDQMLELIDARRRGDAEIDAPTSWGGLRRAPGPKAHKLHVSRDEAEAELRALCVAEVAKVWPDWWGIKRPPRRGHPIMGRNPRSLEHERAAEKAYKEILRAVELAREIYRDHGDIRTTKDEGLAIIGVGRFSAWLVRWGGWLADLAENAPPTGPDATASELQRTARIFPGKPARFVAALAILNGYVPADLEAVSPRRAMKASAIFNKVKEAVDVARKSSESSPPRRTRKVSRPRGHEQ